MSRRESGARAVVPYHKPVREHHASHSRHAVVDLHRGNSPHNVDQPGVRVRGCMEFVLPALNALIALPITLLPIIDPLSTAPIFVATAGRSRDVAARLARQVAINSWIVIVVSMVLGAQVLALFGISLPAVRIGGGLLLAATGWQMLHPKAEDDVQAAVAHEVQVLSDTDIVRRSFFPADLPLDDRSRSDRHGDRAGHAAPAEPHAVRGGRRGGDGGHRLDGGGDLPDLQARVGPARPTRRDRHARDDAAVCLPAPVHRHPVHVHRVGRVQTPAVRGALTSRETIAP